MYRTALLAASLALIAAACGGGDAGAAEESVITTAPTTSAAPSETTSAPPQETTAGAVAGIHLAETELGTVLVDASGFTLYLFTRDVPGASTCVDDCVAAWPPVLVDEMGVPGEGVDAASLGEITRPDGRQQVTYAGNPLYRFAGDGAAGDVAGQGVNDVWFVVGADGRGLGRPLPDFEYEY